MSTCQCQVEPAIPAGILTSADLAICRDFGLKAVEIKDRSIDLASENFCVWADCRLPGEDGLTPRDVNFLFCFVQDWVRRSEGRLPWVSVTFGHGGIDDLTAVFITDTKIEAITLQKWLQAKIAAQQAASPTPRLGVVLEGGLVTAVVSTDPGLVGATAVVIDYDTNDSSKNDPRVVQVPQSDGSEVPAWAMAVTVEPSGIGLAKAYEAICEEG
jgi:hypothetical protein